MTEPSRWLIGDPAPAGPDDGVIALSTTEASLAARAGVVVGFHDAMLGPPRRAGHVKIHLPGYRGKAFVPVLAWLAARLARPHAPVTWHVDRQQGPDSVQRLLEAVGWRLERSRDGRSRFLTGTPPPDPALPTPRGFATTVGSEALEFAADYGVFSPTGIDAGTQLLLDVGLRVPPVAVVADVGTGYGALAIGLVRNGVAARAVVSEVDCVALWLATRNAAANDVAVEPTWTADPTSLSATPLTVCNVPTHINAALTKSLMGALLRRARDGRLLVVVHRSLESRYTAYFTIAGVTLQPHPGPTHVVLDSGAD